MRLWHKDLIKVLPRQQLLGQWRECCLIAKEIAEKGKPNHILVNRITHFSMDHFVSYCRLVYCEMEKRGYKCNWDKVKHCKTKLEIMQIHDPGERQREWLNYIEWNDEYKGVDYELLFKGWHNCRYFNQCYYNLQEKYDCGGITEEEWEPIWKYYWEVMG